MVQTLPHLTTRLMRSMALGWRVVANKFKRRRRGLTLAMVDWLAFTLAGGCAMAPGLMMQSGEIVTHQQNENFVLR